MLQRFVVYQDAKLLTSLSSTTTHAELFPEQPEICELTDDISVRPLYHALRLGACYQLFHSPPQLNGTLTLRSTTVDVLGAM